MKIDFTMTYPCFVSMRSPEEPWTFSSDGDQAVAIHTDYDLLNEFFSQQGQKKMLFRLKCETAEALIEFLSELKYVTSKGQPITHVIIDPSNLSRIVRCYPIPDFIQFLKSNSAVL